MRVCAKWLCQVIREWVRSALIRRMETRALYAPILACIREAFMCRQHLVRGLQWCLKEDITVQTITTSQRVSIVKAVTCISWHLQYGLYEIHILSHKGWWLLNVIGDQLNAYREAMHSLTLLTSVAPRLAHLGQSCTYMCVMRSGVLVIL